MTSLIKKEKLQLCFLTLFAMVQSRVIGGGRQARLTVAEPMPSYYYRNIDGHPGTYAFGYDIADPESGNTQFRTEQRYPNGTVAGSYGYIDARGAPYRYDYIADAKGYRVKQVIPHNPVGERVPLEQSPSSGYYFLAAGGDDDQPELLIISRRPRLASVQNGLHSMYQ